MPDCFLARNTNFLLCCYCGIAKDPVETQRNNYTQPGNTPIIFYFYLVVVVVE